jgi:HTH-type transcriptional regulator/antitoxin HigA
MSRTTIRRAPPKPSIDNSYLDLVKRLPLRPINSRNEHRAAGEVLDELVGRNDLTAGQRDYLAALAHFVADYERREFVSRFRKLTPIELLRELMSANNMNTSDLGYVLGSRGLASEVLNGKRGLSKTLIAKLSRRFGVAPALFLEGSGIPQ